MIAVVEKNYKVVRSEQLSKPTDIRYVVVDRETGKVLDDAQGRGYRERKKAYAAYGFKQTEQFKQLMIEKKKRKQEQISLFDDDHT